MSFEWCLEHCAAWHRAWFKEQSKVAMAGQAKPLPFDCSGMEVPAPMKLGRPMASYYIQSKHEKGATKVHLSSSHKSIMSCHYCKHSTLPAMYRELALPWLGWLWYLL